MDIRTDVITNVDKPTLYHHPITQKTYQVVAEVTKIVAATAFLNFIRVAFLATSPIAFTAVVVAPLVEEVLFRGLLLKSIAWAQTGYNYIRNKTELSEEDRKAQLTFRVHLSSFIFAAAHLTNPHKTIASALTQFIWSYGGGVTYAYLSERYRTLSLSILAHGFNNALATAITVYPQFAGSFLLAALANRIVFYILGHPDTKIKINDKVYFSGYDYATA